MTQWQTSKQEYQGSSTSPPSRTANSTIDQLYKSSEALAELVNRASMIAAAVVGDEPRDKPSGPDQPRPVHLVGSLEYLSMRTDSLISELARQLGRIDGAIGVK